jgi:hypothetical protein
MCPGALSSTGGLVVSATDRFTTYPYRPAAMAAEMNLRQVKRAGHATQTCSMRRTATCCVGAYCACVSVLWVQLRAVLQGRYNVG